MNAPLPSNARRMFLAPNVARNDLSERLKRHTQGEVMFDSFSRARYATDASIYQIQPLGVFVPKTDQDVLSALDIARDLKVPVLPRGAGSSQCGQTVGEALVIDHSKHLNQLVSLDVEAQTAVVQPGMVLDHLNALLKPHGLWFPVDVSTSAQATIGGMAGNNSCGSRSLYYGNMVHNVAAIDAVLADGTQAWFSEFGDGGDMVIANQRVRELVPALFGIADTNKTLIRTLWPKVLRRVGGYNLDIFDCQNERPYNASGLPNLAHLLVGSEGTLAYSRHIKLHLAPLPKAKALGVVNFPSFYQAMQLTKQIVELKPVAVELVDRTMIDLARSNPAFAATIDAALVDVLGQKTQAILLVEFAGSSRVEQLAGLARLTELMADLGLPNSVVEMPDEAAQKQLWEVRKAGLNIMMSMKGDGKPVSFIEDCAVPLEHLAEYTSALTEVFAQHGTKGTWYAHASVGTLHVRPILDMRRDGAEKMRAIANAAGELVRKYKGAFSGEHGDGLVRSEWVQWQFGAQLTQAFEQVKDLFDPQAMMNPGKIVRGTKMDATELFRFPPGQLNLPVTTGLDWSAWDKHIDPITGAQTDAPSTTQGLARAVEMCNNNGHCRKFDSGTMCPSFRVTQDEQHVTRGRANTLRQALSGQLGADALSSQAMFDTMDLCVGCKGCKRDCPTGVDMARMKTEFLYQYRKTHSLTLKDKLIAYLPAYAHLAVRVSGLLNLRRKNGVLARWMEKFTGLAASRDLPVWAPTSFTQSSARAGHMFLPPPAQIVSKNAVILFADTFNNHFETENLRAAKAVLHAAGYEVILSQREGEAALCCGRTYLAAGLIDQARVQARRTLLALLPLVEQGVPVVGLEPSCLLTLRDEFLALGLGSKAQLLSDHAFLLEEFLAREDKAGRLQSFKARLVPLKQTTALLHGHCHQKAFDAVKPVQTVLSWIPGLSTTLIETSCCGMAGSFGYELAHQDVSMKMAELSLLPAIRQTDVNCLVIADGTSCRHQIADGVQRQAQHVAVVLHHALGLS
jgi:FAD/FMN-containing dehydrogenase/Fe-S oxidoreductase